MSFEIWSNNKQTLIQIIAWRWTNDGPIHWRQHASPNLDELIRSISISVNCSTIMICENKPIIVTQSNCGLSWYFLPWEINAVRFSTDPINASIVLWGQLQYWLQPKQSLFAKDVGNCGYLVLQNSYLIVQYPTTNFQMTSKSSTTFGIRLYFSVPLSHKIKTSWHLAGVH